MPELPKVQTIANGLNKKIKNAIISDVFCDWKKMIQKPKTWQEFKKRTVGKKIKKVEKKGKFIKVYKFDTQTQFCYYFII